MSVPDREQLIQAMADEMAASKCWSNRDSAEFDARVFFELAARLGYSVTPAESPAEAPEHRFPGREGSEATQTAERAVIVVQFDWPAHDAERAFQQATYALMPLITSHINEDLHPQATIAIADVAERVIDVVRAAAVETEEQP